jgi:hypothetical protein
LIVLDRLLIGGIRFVLDKLAQTVEKELSDDTVLRQRLLEAQMRLELGELSEDEFAAVEADVLQRIREVRERNTEPAPPPGEMKIAGVEATFLGEEHEPAEPSPGRRRRR